MMPVTTELKQFCSRNMTSMSSWVVQHPVVYFSKILNKNQRNYSTTEKEFSAIVLSIKELRSYIEGTQFIMITDHYSLVWPNSMKNPSQRISRWIIKLSSYRFEIIYRSGSLNSVADSLLRIPMNENEKLWDLRCLQAWKFFSGWSYRQVWQY